MTRAVLEGIRVIDFTTGPCGGLATAVLADFGAHVLKVEPPGGDRFRSLPSSPFWLRGKHNVELDLSADSGQAAAYELVSTADVCVVAGPRDRLVRWGLDSESLGPESLNPGASGRVHCTISGFGLGPDSTLPGYEGVIAAATGRMAAFEGQLRQGRPVYAALPVATHMASQGAVHGIVAALVQRQRTGRGGVVETSLMQGLMPFDLVDLLARQLHVRDGRSFTPLREVSPMPTLNYHPLRTKDGLWIQCGNLLEHLFMSFLDAIDLLGELLIDDRYQASPAEWSAEATEAARDRILVRMQEHTAAEWMSIFDDNANVAAEPILTSAQAIRHRDVACSLVELTDPVVGPTTQIGPIAELERTPGVARPALGAIDCSTWLTEAAPLPEPAGGDQSTGGTRSMSRPAPVAGRPLDGIVILDLSTIIAGPLGVSMLADLGARVIKIEPFAGDPYRQLLIEGRMAVKTNVAKESICIDLKTAAGQAIVYRLAVDADVLVHNFRGSVPTKLGIDIETLHAINPDLIWTAVSGYSAASPSATRPATHPVIGAATGGVAYQAGAAVTRDCPTLADVREASRQIMSANEANPDPNTSAAVASAILLAVLERERHGAGGQAVRVNMQTANAWANGDDFLDYPSKTDRAPVDDELAGLHALYRLYPTAAGWVFLAAPSDREFARLCDRAGCAQLIADERFGTGAARQANDAALARELTTLFATRSADDWQAELSPHGIGCVRADGIEVGAFWCDDPHVRANGWAPTVDHARFGTLRRWGPLTTVDGLNPDYRSGPLAGEHTDAILSELGHSASEIAQLRTDKIVNSEAVELT